MRFTVISMLALLSVAVAFAAPMTDAQVKQAVIQESLASYPGPWPCPYNLMRNGRQCGGNSAYSKPGGYEPICYKTQVTPDMIRAYRQSHGQ